MRRNIQISDSSSSEDSTSDDADSDYGSTYDSGSTNDSDSSHDSSSTSVVKGIEISMNINPNCIQDLLCFKTFLASNTATRAKKRHPKIEEAPERRKKPRTRVEASAVNIWNCGECDFTCVSMDLLREHVETSHMQSKSLFYECKLCHSLEKSLYNHYGKYHVIDFTENLLFNDGTVLVFSSVNTNDGKADWFVKQKAKAEIRLKGHKCRLCEFETDFEDEKRLKHHYTAYHKVHPKCLEIVKFIFRMEKNAHLEKNTDITNRTENASTSKAKTPTKSKKESKNINSEVADSVPLIGLLMYVCKCGVAKETYDASVEHAQKHLALDYNPIIKKCTRCDLTFEAASFDDHASRHNEEDTNVEVFKKLEYDFSTLFSNDWFNMFAVLAKSHIAKIIASSVYKYTRNVKLNWDCKTGIPLYKCGMCNLFVEPAKVHNHSENYGACVNFGPKGHDCTICHRSFSTPKALKIHKDDHENNGAFRDVVFNNENDMQFNKALKMKQYDLHSSEADPQETNEEEAGNARPETNELERNVDARVDKFCDHCNKFVPEYEDHIAAVENERKKKMEALMAMKNCHEIINEHGEDTESKDAEQASHNSSVVVYDGIETIILENGDSMETGNPRRPETNELEKNYDARGDRFCGHCKQFVPDYEEHIASIEKEKKKNDALEMKDCRGVINEYDEDIAKDAEPVASQINNVLENVGVHNEDGNIIDVDAGDIVLPWDSDSDSCDGGEPLITTEAQIHIDVKDYERRSKKVLDGARRA